MDFNFKTVFLMITGLGLIMAAIELKNTSVLNWLWWIGLLYLATD